MQIDVYTALQNTLANPLRSAKALSAHTFIYEYIYIYIFVHTYFHIYIHTHISYIHILIYRYTYISTHVSTYAYKITLRSAKAMTSAQMKPCSKSVWITPAPCRVGHYESVYIWKQVTMIFGSADTIPMSINADAHVSMILNVACHT